jgi:hypothetical protein
MFCTHCFKGSIHFKLRISTLILKRSNFFQTYNISFSSNYLDTKKLNMN